MSVPSAIGGFRKGLLLTSSGDVVSLGLLFVETIIVVRLLPTDAYGTYVLLLATTNLLLMAIDFGCKVAVTQIISVGTRTQQRETIRSALTFRVCILGVVSVLCILVHRSDLIAGFFPAVTQYALLIPIMLIPASLDELLLAMLQGFRSYRSMAVARIGRSSSRVAVTVILLTVFNAGLLALVLSWCITFTLAAAYELIALPIRPNPGWDRSSLLTMLRFGFPLQMARILDFLTSRMQVVLVGALAGVDGVAFYAVATRIPDALATLGDSYFRVYFPVLSNLLTSGQKRDAALLFARSLRLLSFAGGVLAICAVVFRDTIVSLVFSEKYASSALPFGLLMLALQASLLLNATGYTLTAAGRPGLSLVVDVARATVTLVADVIFIPIVGFIGAAGALLLGNYVSNPIALSLVKRSDISLTDSPVARQMVILLLCGAMGCWTPPGGAGIELAYRLGVVALFCSLSIAFAGLSREDVLLILGRRRRGESTTNPHAVPNVGGTGAYEISG